MPSSSQSARLGAVVVVGLAAACADSSEPNPLVCSGVESRVVAPVESWEVVVGVEDPFLAAYAGDAERCEADSIGLEEGVQGTWWEIQTVRCGYVTLAQETVVDLCAGEEVRLRLWHFNLIDAGHDYEIAVSVAGQPELIRETIPVPAGAELAQFSMTLDEDVPAGELIHFHLANHGSNTWGLMDITVSPASE